MKGFLKLLIAIPIILLGVPGFLAGILVMCSVGGYQTARDCLSSVTKWILRD